jgi:hypothetical protein
MEANRRFMIEQALRAGDRESYWLSGSDHERRDEFFEEACQLQRQLAGLIEIFPSKQEQYRQQYRDEIARLANRMIAELNLK